VENYGGIILIIGLILLFLSAVYDCGYTALYGDK
jgi:hypothetical protein